MPIVCRRVGSGSQGVFGARLRLVGLSVREESQKEGEVAPEAIPGDTECQNNMRKFPINKNPKQIRIIKATEDFFGQANREDKVSVTKIAAWLMNRRKRNELNEKEMRIMELVQNNLADSAYFSL